jgi:hypothetical protein
LSITQKADPWVIAHMKNKGMTVVTREQKGTAPNTDKSKIPNVCERFDVRCIDDFRFIKNWTSDFHVAYRK